MLELIPWRCPGCGNWYEREQLRCYECGANNPELSRAAEWVYEAARLEALASERPIVPEPWAQRDQEFRRQFETTVLNMAEQWNISARLPTPEEIHNSWRHMVPFNELQEGEDGREKVAVFLDLIKVALLRICKLPAAVLWFSSPRPAPTSENRGGVILIKRFEVGR